MYPHTISDEKIRRLRDKDGKELLKDYENLSEDSTDFLVECYKRAIIEKYAMEIDYKSEKI